MKPYLRRLLTLENNIVVWEVDGNYIRSAIDIEFTNSGHSYSHTYIPNDEVWIDRDFSRVSNGLTPDVELLLNQALNERSLMRSGKTYLQALSYAGKRAKRERRLRNNISVRDAYADVHIRRFDGFDNVWLVDGKTVRDVFYIHFTEGGHHFVYQFIPYDEIWIDNSLNPHEYKYVILHELIERNLMKYKKLSYHDAHKIASDYELMVRWDNDSIKMKPIDIIDLANNIV